MSTNSKSPSSEVISRAFSDFSACSSIISNELQRLASLPDPALNVGMSHRQSQGKDRRQLDYGYWPRIEGGIPPSGVLSQTGTSKPKHKLSGSTRLQDAIVLGYQLQRVSGKI